MNCRARVVVPLLVAGMLVEQPAAAESSWDGIGAAHIDSGALVIGAGLFVLGVGGLTTTVVNLDHIVRRRPGTGWGVAGLVLGGITLAVGLGTLSNVDESTFPMQSRVGVLEIGLGVVEIGVASWNLARLRPPASLVLPMIQPTSASMSYGLTLRVTSL